jgi:hypothetical protein
MNFGRFRKIFRNVIKSLQFGCVRTPVRRIRSRRTPVGGFLGGRESVYPYQSSRASSVRVDLLSRYPNYSGIVYVDYPAE